MKKLLLLLAFYTPVIVLNAQNRFYSLTVGQAAYANLPSPVAITIADGGGTGYYFNYNLLFPFYNLSASFRANSSVPSLGAFVANDGYVAVYDEPSYVYTAVWQVLVPSGATLVKRTGSALSYAYEGTAGSGILKVEWKNYGITGKHDSEFVNMQLWLDEGSKTVSYHYGPHNVSGLFSFFSGMFLTPNAQFGTFTRSISLEGDPQIPNIDSAAGFSSMPAVDDIPSNGTVYTFSANNSTGVQDTRISDVLVYPNPSNGSIGIQLNRPLGSYQLEMYDVSGKRVFNQQGNEAGELLDISADLPAGLYHLRLSTGDAVLNERVVVE